jgi:hypothetical protein
MNKIFIRNVINQQVMMKYKQKGNRNSSLKICKINVFVVIPTLNKVGIV